MTGRPAAPVMQAGTWVLLLILAVLWGSSFLFFKILVAVLPPLTVVLARVGIAALLLNLWIVLRGGTMPTGWRVWRQFICMGVLNNVIPFTLFVYAEQAISSGLAAILNATTPLFTVLVAHGLTRDETLTQARFAGVVAGFCGVAVLIGPQALTGIGQTSLVNQLACLAAALSYALAAIYGRRFRGIEPIKVATGAGFGQHDRADPAGGDVRSTVAAGLARRRDLGGDDRDRAAVHRLCLYPVLPHSGAGRCRQCGAGHAGVAVCRDGAGGRVPG